MCAIAMATNYGLVTPAVITSSEQCNLKMDLRLGGFPLGAACTCARARACVFLGALCCGVIYATRAHIPCVCVLLLLRLFPSHDAACPQSM